MNQTQRELPRTPQEAADLAYRAYRKATRQRRRMFRGIARPYGCAYTLRGRTSRVVTDGHIRKSINRQIGG